jgi:hypothetical protein
LRRKRIESLFAVKVAGDPEEFFSFLRLGVLDSERDTRVGHDNDPG